MDLVDIYFIKIYELFMYILRAPKGQYIISRLLNDAANHCIRNFSLMSPLNAPQPQFPVIIFNFYYF